MPRRLLLFALLVVSYARCSSAVTFLVTTNADNGPGSLRQAIVDANATPGRDAIYFSIGSGPKIIQVLSPLPEIVDPVELNAATQPGYSNAPIITLVGSAGTETGAGLALANRGSSIVGLMIRGFPYGPGILLTFGGGHVIAGCHAGGFMPDLGNGNGIVLSNSFGNQIGLPRFAPNVILGNFGAGLLLSTSSSNVIEGNYIGTDPTGSVAARNERDGIQLVGADYNTIGGTTAGAGNVISGNRGNGIYLDTSHHNVIEGNRIGSDAEGAVAIPNQLSGINVMFSEGTVIGGITTAARNIISGNLDEGVEIIGFTSVFTTIQGNYIGVNSLGSAALPNLRSGVVLNDAPQTLIGGDDFRARNIISGNDRFGVWLDGPFAFGNIIEGNYIGTDAGGKAAVPNGNGGISLRDAPANSIQSNLISGNLAYALFINGSSNVVVGNFVGTDATGTRGLPSSSDGIAVFGFGNTIGGTSPESRNVISGNAGNGVNLIGTATFGAEGNVVQGNYIGLDVTGRAGIGNSGFGIALKTGANTIGGSEPGAGNHISGNQHGGVWIDGPGTSTNVLHGNYIGTEITGTLGVPNRGPGVFLTLAGRNHVGGTEPGEGNLIAFNTGDGVLVQGSPVGNAILGNSIHSNGRLGINLRPVTEGEGVVTVNDIGDRDTGPNNLQNYPVITNVVYLSNNTIIQGYLRSSTNGSFSIDVYANVATEQSGYGEGQFHLGNVDVDTDENGFTQFAFLTSSAFSNQFFTATALNYDTADTSEFSAAMGGIRITAIQRIASQYRVSFSTITNRTYVLQRASNLNSSMSWSPVVLPPQPIQGTGGIVTVSDTAPGTDTMRVYHVFQQP